MNTSPSIDPKTALRILIGGLAALALGMGIGRFVFTPLLPEMMAGAGLTKSGGGLLASANFVAYLLGAFWFARTPLAKREPYLRMSVGLSIISTTLMGTSSDYLVWLAMRVLSGFASAGVFVLAAGIAIDVIARSGRPRLTGVLYSGVGLGIAGSGLVAAPLAHAFGWQGAWYAMGLLSAALAAPVVSWMRVPPARPCAVKQAASAASARSDGWMLARLSAAYLLEGLSYSVSATFLVTIVLEASPEGGAGGVWAVVGVAAALSAAIVPMMIGRFRMSFLLITLYAVQSVGISLPIILPGIAGAYGGAVLFGGTFMAVVAISMSYGRRLAGERFSSEVVVGLLTGLYGLGQVVGPVVAGYVAQSQGFALPLMVSSGLAALGGVVIAINWWKEQGD